MWEMPRCNQHNQYRHECVMVCVYAKWVCSAAYGCELKSNDGNRDHVEMAQWMTKWTSERAYIINLHNYFKRMATTKQTKLLSVSVRAQHSRPRLQMNCEQFEGGINRKCTPSHINRFANRTLTLKDQTHAHARTRKSILKFKLPINWWMVWSLTVP